MPQILPDLDLKTLLDRAISELTPDELVEYQRDLEETFQRQNRQRLLSDSVNCKTCVIPVGKCKELWDRVYIKMTSPETPETPSENNVNPDSLKFADWALKEYLWDREKDIDVPEYLRVTVILADQISPDFAFTNPRFTVTSFPNSKTIYVSIKTTTFQTLTLDLCQIERELYGKVRCISGVNPSPALRQMSMS